MRWILMSKGSVVIISGPSGSGKDTILRLLLSNNPEIKFSISSTTRPMREEDKVTKKYDFLSVAEFEAMIENDQLLEYNCYVGNYYGTPRKPVEDAVNNGKDMIIEVDVNGAANIRKKMPEAVSIFIMPPSFEELERRLLGRGTDSKEVVAARLKTALEEIKRAPEYDYIVVNGDIDTAVNDVLAIIKADGLKLNKQKYIIDEVLENAKS
jgi:guanylate kinase